MGVNLPLNILYRLSEIATTYVEIFLLFGYYDLFLIPRQEAPQSQYLKQAVVILITAGVVFCNSIQLVSYITLILYIPVLALSSALLYTNRLLAFKGPSAVVITLFYCISLLVIDFSLPALITRALGIWDIDRAISCPSPVRLVYILTAKALCCLSYLCVRRIVQKRRYALFQILLFLGDMGAILLLGSFLIVHLFHPNSGVLFNNLGVVTIIFFCLLAAVFHIFFQLYERARQNERYKRLNAEKRKLEEKLTTYMAYASDLSAQAHDFKNHLLAIQGMAKSAENRPIACYIDELLPALTLTTLRYYTECSSINAIINYKKECAASMNVGFEAAVRLPGDFQADASDLVVILSNLIDNCLDYFALNDGMPDKRIRVTVEKRHAFIQVKVQNTAVSDPSVRIGSTTKRDKLRHGKGLCNIRHIVEKYHGDIQMIYQPPYFTVSIFLCA